MAKNSL